MRQLSHLDCESLLAVAAELYSVPDVDLLPQTFLKAVQGMIPHEFAGCHDIQPSRRVITAFYAPERKPTPAQHKDFWRLSHQHPLHPVLFTGPSRAWKLSDVMSRQAFRATECYNTLYRPLEVDCELVAAVPDETTPGAYCLITLHRNGRDFSERDRTVLDLLLPHVAAARRSIHGRAGQARRGNAALTSGMGPELLSEETLFHQWLQGKAAWELTAREGQVLFWLVQGKTNAEIGQILGIAERTAETHALHIYPKIGVENRYNAIATLNRLAFLERQ